MHHRQETTPPGRPLTGRTVLACFIAFFGVVFAVNAVMVRFATSTFGGVETESAYKAGLAFAGDIRAARAQEALGWRVEARLAADGDHASRIDIDVRDAAGRAPGALDVSLVMNHPTDRRFDRAVQMTRVGAGSYRGSGAIAPGQWDMIIELSRDGDRVFRSRNRVIVR